MLGLDCREYALNLPSRCYVCASDVSSCAWRSSSSFRCELCSCCIVDTGVASWPANNCTPSNLCPSTPETLGDNEGDFSRVRFCAASRILASVASFLEAPRRVMIVSCAPVMEEVRVHQRRKLKRTHPLHESIDLFYIQNTMTSVVHHRLGRCQAE